MDGKGPVMDKWKLALLLAIPSSFFLSLGLAVAVTLYFNAGSGEQESLPASADSGDVEAVHAAIRERTEAQSVPHLAEKAAKKIEGAAPASAPEHPSESAESEHEKPVSSEKEAAHALPEKPAHALPEEPAQVPETEIQRMVRETIEAGTADQGIAKIQTMLEQAHSPEEGIELHVALGRLYTQLTPPDDEKALAAFEQAMALSTDLEARLGVFRQQVDILLRRGAGEQARAHAEKMLEEAPPDSSSRLSLGLLLGQIWEMEKAPEKAESIYRTTWKEAVGGTLDPSKEEILRLIALRLVRIYRASGRDKDADKLAQQVKGWRGEPR